MNVYHIRRILFGIEITLFKYNILTLNVFSGSASLKFFNCREYNQTPILYHIRPV